MHSRRIFRQDDIKKEERMDIIREWCAALIMMVAAGAFMEMSLPEGSMRKYVSFIFALMILDILLAPLARAGGAAP